MKFLVLGASGMAGHVISIYLKEQGHEVVALTRKSFPYCSNIILDVAQTNELAKVIKNGKFDCIINCVGILNEFAEQNKDEAVLLNSYLPHFLVMVTKGTKTKIIHMSTDCVFSGRTGGYKEDTFKDGETFYDRSKALGEIDNDKDLTFRNSIIGPDTSQAGIGLFNWYMKQNGIIKGFTNAIWTGVTTLTLAKAMEKATLENLTGVYNLVNNETINKYNLLKLFSSFFTENELNILKDDKVKIDKSLINTRTDFSFIVPSYEEMIAEMNDWILTHRELYPHYF